MATAPQKNIPNGWQQARLGDISDITNGKTNTQDAVTHGEYPLFDRSVAIKRSNKYLFDDTAVILPGEGAEFVPRYYSGKFDLHQRVYAIFPNETVYPLFLYQYLYANRAVFAQNAVGSTVKSLRLPIIQAVDVLLPTLPEQMKIAEILSAVDAEIQKTDEIITSTEKLKHGLMKQFLSANKSSTKKRFSELASLRKEAFDPKTEASEKYVGLEHIDQNSGALLGFGDSIETASIKTRFYAGDILFGKLRPYLRKYWKANFSGVCTTEILVFQPKEKRDAEFIFYLTQSDQFINHSNSKSFGTKMPRTDWNIVSEFEFFAPSPIKRQEIGTLLTLIDQRTSINRKMRGRLVLLKKGLMHDLLSGKKKTI
ncbi:restriction endonuclease subunit S [Candidatus Nomurabacteria bacterium]|nr:restriction endonuclease subunit S [Candidatus Nomurabacteria bacterium]